MKFCYFLMAFVIAGAWMGSTNVVFAWCQATVNQSFSANLQECPEGTKISWRRPCIPFSLDGRGLDQGEVTFDEISQIANRVFDAWSSVSCEDQSLGISIEQTALPSYCRAAEFNFDVGNVNTIAFPPTWDSRKFSSQALAATVVFFNSETGEIFDGDILLNTTLGKITICPQSGCRTNDDGRKVDLENVLSHEVGHFFGLAHSLDSQATMFGSSPPGEVIKRTLGLDDKTGICEIYKKTIFTRTCDFSPENGLDLNCENNGSKGCQIGLISPSGFKFLWFWLGGIGIVFLRRFHAF